MQNLPDYVQDYIKELNSQKYTNYIKELKEIIDEDDGEYIVCGYSAHVLHNCADFTEYNYYIASTYTVFCRPNKNIASSRSRAYRIENHDFDNIDYIEMYGLKVTTQEQTLQDLCVFRGYSNFACFVSKKDLKQAIHKYLETHSKSGLIKLRMLLKDREAEVMDKAISEIKSMS